MKPIRTDSSRVPPGLTVAVETSSRWGSLAVAIGCEVVAERPFSGPLRHSVELLPSLRDLLADVDRTPRQIDTVGLSIGPGSFTGLRIAVTLAKTLALATGCRVVPVSSLDVAAANVTSPPAAGPCLVAPVLDAKRGQCFTAAYRWNGDAAPRKVLGDVLQSPEAFRSFCEEQSLPTYLLGEGLLYLRERVAGDWAQVLPESLWSPRARRLCELTLQRPETYRPVDPLTLKPTYLREALVTPKPR